MNKKIALVSDFDGTISPEDFFWYVSDAYLNEAALEPWQQYRDGKMSHLDALNTIFGELRIPNAEFDSFIKKIPIDNAFEKVAILCNEKQIPLYICSAGCDYYIKKIIGQQMEKYNIHLVTNKGVYSEQKGLEMIPPANNTSYYDAEVGISKAAVVGGLLQDGYEVVFAGDGPPDVAPAKLANVVFAKKILLEECQRLQISTQLFRNFEDIYAYLKEV